MDFLYCNGLVQNFTVLQGFDLPHIKNFQEVC